MATPSRKNRMMQRIIANQETQKKENVGEIKDKEISEEEHKKRVEKLKALGLIK